MTEKGELVDGRYRLLERLGSGAMGVVWLGRDEQLDRLVAIKQLIPRASFDEASTRHAHRRVIREGRIAARLQHAHAISVYNVVEHGEYPWLVMEYLPSRSLAAVLAQRGTLPPGEAATVGVQAASALAQAHRAGIVHRDVKPGNVLIAEDGTAKITDFGISRAAGDGTVTVTGDIAGTPAFLAPEVARGEEATFASDVFSLGATLYNAVEGTPPFGLGENAIALLYRVTSGRVTPPQRAGALTPVLRRLLAPEPADRPTMAEARTALTEVTGGGTASTAPRTRRRRRATLAALTGVATAAMAAVAILLAKAGGGEQEQADSPPSSALPSAAATLPPSSAPQATSDAESPAARERAVTDYYALLPGNLRDAYARLTESFKRERAKDFAVFARFWEQMRAVDVSGVTARDGNRVSATVTYTYADGRSATEQHVYTLVRAGDGWAIDAQQLT